MTNEEAIWQLEGELGAIETSPYRFEKNWQKSYEAMKMAIEALEYRTPKKIKWSNGVYVCPRCGIVQQSAYTILPCRCVYCHNCGQAIDWSEVEE